MKRLLLALAVALAFFMASFAFTDLRAFLFRGRAAGPSSDGSVRPEVERALAVLDRAMIAYYTSGDERPARAAVAATDGDEGPLELWRVDRRDGLRRGRNPVPTLLSREPPDVVLLGLDEVSATARERWSTEGSPPTDLRVRYGLRRVEGTFRVATVTVEP